MILNIIVALIVGALTGYAAGKIMKQESDDMVKNCIIGIIGGLIGSLLFGLLGFTVSNIIGQIISSIVGACILLAIKKYFLNK